MSSKMNLNIGVFFRCSGSLALSGLGGLSECIWRVKKPSPKVICSYNLTSFRALGVPPSPPTSPVTLDIAACSVFEDVSWAGGGIPKVVPPLLL